MCTYSSHLWKVMAHLPSYSWMNKNRIDAMNTKVWKQNILSFSYPVIHECTEMKLTQWILNKSPEGRKYEISPALVHCNDNNQTQWNGEQD